MGLTEELALAGHHAELHQRYLFDHQTIASIFDHANGQSFFLAGHFENEELRRISTFANMHQWREHISDIPQSANVLRNIAGSMISNFTECQAVCPCGQSETVTSAAQPSSMPLERLRRIRWPRTTMSSPANRQSTGRILHRDHSMGPLHLGAVQFCTI